jgi:hypothetical protein
MARKKRGKKKSVTKRRPRRKATKRVRRATGVRRSGRPSRKAAKRATRKRASTQRATTSARPKRRRAAPLEATTADPRLLRLDQVSLVMLHNSYARSAVPAGGIHAPSNASAFDTYVESLYRLGVRGLELDFAQEPGGRWRWSVGHADQYDPTLEVQLHVYLRALRKWSDDHPGHDPMIVYLEAKSLYQDGWADAFEDYVGQSIPADRIYRPLDLRGTHPDLQAAVRACRWPTIAALRGRFVFVVSGDGAEARAVASRRDSLCFGDRALTDTPGRIADTNDPNRPIVNFPSPELRHLAPGGLAPVSETRWIEILSELARDSSWLLPRVYYADEPRHVREALEYGAWIIATNEPEKVLESLGGAPWRPRVVGQPIV